MIYLLVTKSPELLPGFFDISEGADPKPRTTVGRIFTSSGAPPFTAVSSLSDIYKISQLEIGELRGRCPQA